MFEVAGLVALLYLYQNRRPLQAAQNNEHFYRERKAWGKQPRAGAALDFLCHPRQTPKDLQRTRDIKSFRNAWNSEASTQPLLPLRESLHLPRVCLPIEFEVVSPPHLSFEPRAATACFVARLLSLPPGGAGPVRGGDARLPGGAGCPAARVALRHADLPRALGRRRGGARGRVGDRTWVGR